MAAAGHYVPAIEERDDLTGYEWIWNAFIQLNTTRPQGYHSGPIPWTAINDWCLAYRLSDTERWFLGEVITHMSDVWFSYGQEKRKKLQKVK